MKRILFGVLITLTLTGLAFAQRGMPPNPLRGLQNALNLTESQIDSVKTLMQTERERTQPIMMDIQQKRQALDALLNVASPVPVDVGNAAIALKAAENQLRGEHDWFISQLRNLLTGDQQQKLDTLLAANPQFPLGGFGPRPGPRFGRGPRPQ